MTMIQTEGKFTCTITDAMIDKAKSGNPQICLVCEVDDERSDEYKRAITWYGNFSGDALQYTVDALVKACGYSGNGGDLWQFLTDVRGKRVQIVTQFNEYNGRTTLKARWLNPLSQAPSDEEQFKLAMMLAGAIDQYKSSKTGLPPTSGDDIPF